MKLLSTLAVTLAALAFAGAASAQCSGAHQPVTDQTAETPILILPETKGS